MPWNRRTTRRDRKRRKAHERQMQRTFNRLFHEHTCRMVDMLWQDVRHDWNQTVSLSLRVEQPRRTMTLVIYDDPPTEHPISEIRELHDIVVNAMEPKKP